MKIYRIVRVTVIKSDQKIVIQADGLVARPGWTGPELLSEELNPADRVLEFAYEATPPDGIVPAVLTPISASTVVDDNGIDGFIVRSRTNSIEVHASQFQTADPRLTTLAIGEEDFPSTRAIGEEAPPWTTLAIGEEGEPFTTLRLGEEEPTLRFGEGPLGTNPRVDDPAIFSAGGGLTTLALGEEGGPADPREPGRSTPFGQF